MKRLLSVIFPLSLAAIILIVSVTRFDVFSRIQITAIALYLAWIFFEGVVSKRDFSGEGRSKDHFTKELYAISQGLTFISAIVLFRENNGFALQMTGFCLLLPGLLIRIISVSYLRKYYSHNVRLLDDHKIITSGPYSLIRHPAYAGMSVIHIAVSLMFWNIVTPVLFALLLMPAILIRIRTEERALNELPAYKHYCERTKRLIPFVW